MLKIKGYQAPATECTTEERRSKYFTIRSVKCICCAVILFAVHFYYNYDTLYNVIILSIGEQMPYPSQDRRWLLAYLNSASPLFNQVECLTMQLMDYCATYNCINFNIICFPIEVIWCKPTIKHCQTVWNDWAVTWHSQSLSKENHHAQ